MNCEKCGEFCQCRMEPSPIELPVPDSATASETVASLLNTDSLAGDSDSEAWRNELSARLNRYRSRRKAPPPRYPSLRLPFDPTSSALKATAMSDSRPEPAFESAGCHALALDATESGPAPVETAVRVPLQETERPAAPRASQSGAKIIEFPRFAWGPPPPPPDQLAGPVIDPPRILEVAEIAPPVPALGGITIEPARVEEPEKRPGIDIPLQSAPLALRMLASVIDLVVVGAASAVFGFIFWKIAVVRPPQIQLLSLAAGIPCIFWAAYQYLLMVYAGTTPGLRLARLQLARFDGTSTRRSLRRWRVLASYLSAASLGMGYVWLFLDEDNLCWHDRITHTYIAPLRRPLKRAISE
jgi:hypothetical protein